MPRLALSSPLCSKACLALAACGLLLAPTAVRGQGAAPAAPAVPVEVVAGFLAASLPRLDPAAPEWSRVTRATVLLMPQDVTEPRLVTPGIPQVDVQALHDGRQIAFRLDWADPTENRLMSSTLFSDAAAVQLPTAPGPDVPAATMGQPGQPVELHLWKAAWQDAADGVEFTSKTLFPNLWVDHYPDEVAPAAVAGEIATRRMPARAAGNPNLTHHTTGTVPIQDLLAEGFGSATPQKPGRSVGLGRYASGRWSLVVSRPLAPVTGGPSAMAPGHRTYVAFAVWDGAAAQAGARKMRSGWIPLTLEAGK